MKNVKIREFKLSDWDVAWKLWEKEIGEGNDASWEKDKVALFLDRNPKLSLVAVIDGVLSGTVMCGYDGRRGYIYHLAVADVNKRKGIGTALMKLAISKLEEEGASKVHLMVFVENECAKRFYHKLGFANRNDITLMSSSTI